MLSQCLCSAGQSASRVLGTEGGQLTGAGGAAGGETGQVRH